MHVSQKGAGTRARGGSKYYNNVIGGEVRLSGQWNKRFKLYDNTAIKLFMFIN